MSGFISNAVIAIASATILARSGNDAPTLASVTTAMGVGGSIGAILLSISSGPKRRIHCLLLGDALTNLCRLPLGLALSPAIWVAAGSFSGFFMPWLGVFNQGIWLSKVEPEVQGRVFASRYLIAQIASPLGIAISGPLADYVFEPAMQTGGFLAGIFSGIFGTGNGAGMALQFTLFSCCGILISLGGYAFKQLRDVEILLPDHE
ncbi:MAG: MFS transporter [Okeania sp. SIO2H7]|nr:MFS transporter [Okeania sp. SIO2H7]